MTNFELLAAVVLFLVGYWVVSAFWPKRGRKDDMPGESPAGESWHEVLGVSPTATPEEIERAYRARLDEYRPDRVAGLGPELQAVARRMTERINAAYAAGLDARR